MSVQYSMGACEATVYFRKLLQSSTRLLNIHTVQSCTILIRYPYIVSDYGLSIYLAQVSIASFDLFLHLKHQSCPIHIYQCYIRFLVCLGARTRE